MSEEPVIVSFTYVPQEPDTEDETGMSEAEFIRLMDQVLQIGGYDVEIRRFSDERR